MLILGYFLCLVMGLTLGLIGAGGSILVFPILVYFFNTSPVHATSYSLVIVGLTALVGFLHYIKNRSFIVPDGETIESCGHNTRGKDRISVDKVLDKILESIN